MVMFGRQIATSYNECFIRYQLHTTVITKHALSSSFISCMTKDNVFGIKKNSLVCSLNFDLFSLIITI